MVKADAYVWVDERSRPCIKLVAGESDEEMGGVLFGVLEAIKRGNGRPKISTPYTEFSKTDHAIELPSMINLIFEND